MVNRIKERWSFPHLFLLVFALGLILRLLHLSNLITGPYFRAPIMDALYHDLWARRFVAGQLPHQPFFRAPLYPTLLGIIYALCGRDFFLPRLLGILFGMGTALFTFFIGRRIFGRTVGFIATSVLLFYWPYVYFETELLIPATLILLSVLSFHLLLKIEDSPKNYLCWIGSGLCFGLAAITRPNILLFMPVAIIWLLGRYGRKSLLRLIVFIIALSAIVGSVTVCNYILGKDTVLISSQAGVNFYIGNNPDADGYTAKTPLGYNWYGEYEDSVALFAEKRAEQLTGREMKPSEISRFWFHEGLNFWRQQPGDALKLLVKKSYLFWNAYEIKNNKDLYFQKRFSWVLRLPLFTFGIVSVAGLLGMGLWLIRIKGRKEKLFSPQVLLISYVFLYMVSVCMFFVCGRYRLPIVPVLAIFGAYWLVEITGHLHLSLDGRGRPVAPGEGDSFSVPLNNGRQGGREESCLFIVLNIVIFAVLSLLLRLDPYGVRDTNFAEEHWSAGNSFQESGRLEKSIVEYKAALAERPDYVDAWVNLGNSYYALQQYGEAEKAYLKTVKLNSKYAKAYNNLAQLYLITWKPDEALDASLKAVEIERGNAVYRNTLGEVYIALKSYDNARRELEAAARIYPTYTRAFVNLAKLAIAQNETGKAKSSLMRALEIDPANKEAKELLGEM